MAAIANDLTNDRSGVLREGRDRARDPAGDRRMEEFTAGGLTSTRGDWERRIGRRGRRHRHDGRRPAAAGVVEAEGGAGQVTLRWTPVDGAIGYLVHAPTARRAWAVDHGGRDVLDPPGPVYCDTTGGEPDVRVRWYAVASTSRSPTAGPASCPEPVEARRSGGGAARAARRRVAAVGRPRPPVADGRLGAPLAAALRRADGRAPDRRGLRGGARLAATRSSAPSRCARTRSSTTSSASTARRTASRSTTSAPSTASTTACSTSGCGPSSSSRSCRATWRGSGGDGVRVPRPYLAAARLGPVGRS